MCGRFSLAAGMAELRERFLIDAPDFPPLLPRYNIAPSQPVLVVLSDEKRKLLPMKWGLVPSWAKDPAIGYKMINARAETVLEKPSYKRPFTRRRCLIPVDGFFEWSKTPPKIPMHFRMKTAKTFALAGLWEEWEGNDGHLFSFTIITTAANTLVGRLHHRMPVIIDREDDALWLDPAMNDTAKVLPLLKPYPSEKMEGYKVSTLVNSPKNDSPRCVEPAKP